MSVEGKGISMFDSIRDTGKLFWVRPYNQCEVKSIVCTNVML